VAKATREFQALFLMELMKPMTEELADNSLLGEEGGTRSDLYSWFWNEALAKHMAGAWPLPSIPGAAEVAKTAAITALQKASIPLNAAACASSASPSAASPSTPAGMTGASPSAVRSPSSGTSSSSPTETHGAFESLIERVGRLFSLPVNLVRAVVQVESGGQHDAVSGKGAVGLMQLMPETAREMGISDPRNPWENLYAGAKYLSRQLERFGSVEKALAAYNAGPSSVEEHGGVPPYPETRRYVQRVLAAKARLDSNPADV
jgi:soluble lytic murein transglycosylase-like protein